MPTDPSPIEAEVTLESYVRLPTTVGDESLKRQILKLACTRALETYQAVWGLNPGSDDKFINHISVVPDSNGNILNEDIEAALNNALEGITSESGDLSNLEGELPTGVSLIGAWDTFGQVAWTFSKDPLREETLSERWYCDIKPFCYDYGALMVQLVEPPEDITEAQLEVQVHDEFPSYTDRIPVSLILRTTFEMPLWV